MSRAHYFQTISDPEGNLVTNATVTVHDPDTLAYISQQLWADDAGSMSLTNPFSANNGFIEFYMNDPDRVLLRIDAPGYSSFQIYADVLPPADRLVLSDNPLHFSGAPEAGKIVKVSTDGTLSFADAPVGLSPKVTVNSWPLTGVTVVPPDWTFSFSGTGVSSSYKGEIVADAVDVYTNVYQFQGNSLGTVTSTPLVMTFSWTGHLTDFGSLTFWYSIAGDSTLRVLIDSLPVFTSAAHSGYASITIDSISAGDRVIKFEYSLTGNTAGSLIRLAGITLTQGGVVSPHYHDGTGLNSLALGQNTTATQTDATAVGDTATASGLDTTAIGYGAQATSDYATAVGSTASAGNYGVAVGYGATALGVNSVASGAGTNVARVGGVAMGYQATVNADYGIAVGYQSVSDGSSNSIAIGRGSAAHAPYSIAIGANSAVAQVHQNSIALGTNVATTAPNQIMVGDTTYTTLVPGALRALGNVQIGAANSKVGFFGSLGVTKPTVTGSRSGNVALGSLISSLAALGMITDGTSA